MTRIKLDRHFSEALFCHCLHDSEQIGLKKRENDLCLGITEAAVVLNDLGAVLGNHKAEVQTSLKSPSLFVHRLHRRQKDRSHALLGDILSVIWIGSDSSHSTGI